MNLFFLALLYFPALQSGESTFKDELQLGIDRIPFLAAESGCFCFGNVGTLFHLNTTLPVCKHVQLGLMLSFSSLLSLSAVLQMYKLVLPLFRTQMLLIMCTDGKAAFPNPLI